MGDILDACRTFLSVLRMYLRHTSRRSLEMKARIQRPLLSSSFTKAQWHLQEVKLAACAYGSEQPYPISILELAREPGQEWPRFSHPLWPVWMVRCRGDQLYVSTFASIGRRWELGVLPRRLSTTSLTRATLWLGTALCLEVARVPIGKGFRKNRFLQMLRQR